MNYNKTQLLLFMLQKTRLKKQHRMFKVIFFVVEGYGVMIS
jgi:hypothetical protein